MQQFLKKNWVTALISAAVMTLTVAMSARLLLRHISLFLSFDDQFSAIFAQTHDGKLTSPVVLLMTVSFPISLGLRKLWERKLLRAILLVLLWLLLLLMALLLTRVNGIRFGDVLFSLLDVFQKGGFDGL